MKTLYWNRIQIFQKNDSIWFDIMEPDIEDDFNVMFAKIEAKKTEAKKEVKKKSNKQECVKLLEAKRAQQLGIIMSSKHLDIQVVRDSLIDLSSDVLNYETLNAIYSVRPTEDEIKQIEDYVKLETGNEDLLDKPEAFLLELSRIPFFEQRLYCIIYQNKFHEIITGIDFKLNNVATICEELITSDKIKHILGIVIACGNYMNWKNKMRGDADGFDLSILPKLKDVKSKDNSTTLLHYIASYFINKCDANLTNLPLPDQSDFNFVSGVNYDEVESELRQLQKQLANIQQQVDDIVNAGQATADESMDTNFKVKMDEFLTNSGEEVKEQEENFQKCKDKFKKVTSAFCLKPKGNEPEVTPEYFFSLWAQFSMDFKVAWKREGQVHKKQE